MTQQPLSEQTTINSTLRAEDTLHEKSPAALEDAKPANPPQGPAMTFPDGGLQAWSVVAGSWLALFCSFGTANTFGVYQDFYTREFLSNKTASDISWIGSVQLFFLFASALPAGLLFDMGYFRHLTISGLLLFCFSHFMLSLAKPHQYYQVFLAQGIGIGIGMGLLFLPPLALLSHYFRRNRVFATGIVISGSSCGGIIFPIMLNQLINKNGASFGWSVRAISFVMLGCLIVATLLMKTRLPNRRQREKMGIMKEKHDLKGIVTDRAFLMTAIGGFLVGWGLFFPFFYVQLYAVSHGISQTLSFYTLAILNAASVFGRTIPNFLADKFGVYNITVVSVLLCSGLEFALFGASTPGGAICFSIFYGFCSGAFASMLQPVLIVLTRSVGEIGFRSGIGMFIVSWSVLTGTPITGALLGNGDPNSTEPGGGYRWSRAIIFSGVVVFAGMVCMLCGRFMAVKRKGTQIV